MKALLLCAGQSSRWKPYDQKYSKMCLPFLNIPIVGYSLKILEDIGVQHVVMNTHHHAHQVQRVIKDLNINIPHQSLTYEPQLLEGIGTLFENRYHFKKEEDIIYMNGDSVFLCDDFFESMKKHHHQNNALVTFLVTPTSHCKNIWANEEDQIEYVGLNASKKSLKGYFFSGFCLISSECLSLLQETDRHLFRDVLSRHSSRCSVFSREDLKFFEVGDLKSYLHATKKCFKYLFEESSSMEASLLEKTLSRFCPDFKKFKGSHYYSQSPFDSHHSGHLLCGSDVLGLNSRLTIKNFAVIGDHVDIQKPLTIDSGVVGSHCLLNESIEQSLLLRENL